MAGLKTTAVGGLADRLDGEVLEPGDDEYDAARRVWNAMVDRRPALIVRCASAGDVAHALRFAREQGLEIGVRCGGHSILGFALPDGGLTIDLRPMAAVRVDPERRRAWVQGGALLGALDRATQAYGLATTAGNVSHTGVGGLTLGGGMGWLARRCGLSCDNVESFELVTAAGEQVRASATVNPELFWGLRGGGGNFGIVTEFEFRLHAVGTRTLVADFFVPVAEAAPALRGWRDLSAAAPRQATFTASVGAPAAPSLPSELQGRALASVGFVWVGAPDEGRELLPAMRALGPFVAESVEELSYVDLQCAGDSILGPALRRYWKGHYLRELTDDAIDALLASAAPEDGEIVPAIGLQAYGGAIADVPDSATAFSHRATAFEFVASTRWADPAEDERRMRTARRCAAALDPFASGVYVNALSDDGAVGVRRAYPPDKLARLQRLKDVWDPDNVFHRNANIPPSPRG